MKTSVLPNPPDRDRTSAGHGPGTPKALLSPEFIQEWRVGWRVAVAASLASGVGIALNTYLTGLFTVPLQRSFGWTRTQIATASMFSLLSLVIMPITGRIVDRHGARKTAVIGLFVWSLVALGLALQTGQLWLYYALLAAGAAVGVSTSVVVFTRPVVATFDRARGSALGLTMAGSGISSLLLYPIIGYVIGHFGWRYGYGLIALFPLVVGIPITLLWLDRAGSAGVPVRVPRSAAGTAAPAFRTGEVVADSRFWLLILAMVAGNIPVGGILYQLQPMLHSKGFTLSVAALLGSVFSLAVALGRVVCGLLLDRFPPAIVIPVCLSAPILAAAVMLAPSPSLMVAALAVAGFGLAQGIEADFLAFFVARYFGIRSYSTLYGLLLAISASALSSGSIIYARIFDTSGDYSRALIAQMLLLAVTAGTLVLSERVHRHKLRQNICQNSEGQS